MHEAAFRKTVIETRETLETSIDRELVKKFADQFLKMYTEGRITESINL